MKMRTWLNLSRAILVGGAAFAFLQDLAEAHEEAERLKFDNEMLDETNRAGCKQNHELYAENEELRAELEKLKGCAS